MSMVLTEPATQPLTAVQQRLKIAYIPSRFPKLTETFVLYEILELRRAGIEVEIYPLQREREEVRHAEADTLAAEAFYTPLLSWAIIASNIRMFARQPIRYLGTLFAALWANLGSLRYLGGVLVFFPKAVHLADRMQRRGVGFVHGAFASHPAMVAHVIHRLTGIPYSFTAHGSDLHRDQHMLREKVGRAAFVVAISEYNRRMIVELCGTASQAKVRVIHCGVDVSRFLPVERSCANSAGPLQIVCIGTLHEVKGHKYLLAACQMLQRQNIDFNCHLIGDGPDRSVLQTQASELGIREKVIFHGQQPRDRVREVLTQADVLVAPSVPTKDGRREGIPVVLMEALASGVPVVASDLSGIPELVLHESTGLLVAPGDAAGIATALVRLSNYPSLRQQLATQGRERVLAEFDLKANAAKLAAAMQEACL